MRVTLAGAVLAFLPALARAQESSEPEEVAAPAPEYGVAPDFLKTLPHPPDQPRSLFQPAPSYVHLPQELEQPYFEPDYILDPPQWGQPGWFWDVQVAGVKPHIQNEMFQNVVTGMGSTIPVSLGNSPLDWTVTPRFEFGYRLPSGFGEFAISDRAMTANGSDTFAGPDGPAMRSSSLQFNVTDLDYLSREYTPSPCWEMKWRLGMRFAETFTTTTVNEPFAQAAAGSTVFASSQSNGTFGFGPHIAVELERALGDSGFSLVGKVDVGYNYTTIHQRFAAVTTSLDASGVPDSGITINTLHDAVIMLYVQAGVAWQPAKYPCGRLFLGYIQETWWNTMHNGNLLSLGQFDYQGVFLRASWNY
jgi:hypothetical protein